MTSSDTIAPFEWLKQIPSALLKHDETPLLGYPPLFPWSAFSDILAEIFEEKTLKIEPSSAVEWRAENTLYEGLGSSPKILCASLAPSGGKIYWAMASQDISLLMSLLLTRQSQAIDQLDAEFKESFLKFIGLEAIHAITKIDFDHSLSFHLLDKEELPHEASLCLDISITLQQRTFWGRLILSEAFRREWKERFAEKMTLSTLTYKLTIPLQLEIGRVSFSPSEWSDVSVGDFIVLDKCSLKSDREGPLLLMYNDIPLFHGQLKEGQIKILEYPLHYEDSLMEDEDKKETQDDAEADPFKDQEEGVDPSSDYDQYNDELFETEEPQEDGEHFEGDETLEEEEDEEATELSKEAWPPPPDHPYDHRHHPYEDVEKPAVAVNTVEEEAEEPAPEQTETEPSEEEGQTFSLGAVPFSISVEIGRLQITLKELMDLQPGNLLDLNVRPEKGVDLVVRGKKIGKGELLKIGDTLGVRILDIG